MWVREFASKQYQSFKQRRIEMEINKCKNEKRLDNIEKAKKKAWRNRFIKERTCAEISHYGGLWLKEQKNDAKLAELRTDWEKRAALKY